MHKVNVDDLFEGKQSKYALVLMAIEEIKNHEIDLVEPDEDEI